MPLASRPARQITARPVLWLGAGLAAVMLAACGEREPNADLPPTAPANPFAEAELHRFVCGELEVNARFIEDRARLEADSQTIDLIQVEAASGARYEAAGDPLTVFWSQGDEASLTLSGESYPECQRVSGE